MIKKINNEEIMQISGGVVVLESEEHMNRGVVCECNFKKSTNSMSYTSSIRTVLRMFYITNTTFSGVDVQGVISDKDKYSLYDEKCKNWASLISGASKSDINCSVHPLNLMLRLSP